MELTSISEPKSTSTLAPTMIPGLVPGLVPGTTVSVRGIAPKLLLSQVLNTAPFLAADSFQSDSQKPLPYCEILLRGSLSQVEAIPESDIPSYFRFCLAAHYASVGTFVPTDVDNTIRFKLWSPELSLSEIERMVETVIEAKDWDPRPVCKRWVASPQSGEILQGHDGEWFSVAVAAYGALKKRVPDTALEFAEWIAKEALRQISVYEDLRRAKDGWGMLKAATLLAHNLGDLDRVTDQWNLPQNDAMRMALYQLGHEDSKGPPSGSLPQVQDLTKKLGLFKEAGLLNKQMMASENHRHFALRKPRSLRKSQDFLIPLAPFWDSWGAKLGKHPELSEKDLGEIIESLIEGWMKLPETWAYARALAGIESRIPGGLKAMSKLIPAKMARTLEAGPLRTQISLSPDRFEGQWKSRALKFAKLDQSR